MGSLAPNVEGKPACYRTVGLGEPPEHPRRVLSQHATGPVDQRKHRGTVAPPRARALPERRSFRNEASALLPGHRVPPAPELPVPSPDVARGTVPAPCRPALTLGVSEAESSPFPLQVPLRKTVVLTISPSSPPFSLISGDGFTELVHPSERAWPPPCPNSTNTPKSFPKSIILVVKKQSRESKGQGHKRIQKPASENGHLVLRFPAGEGDGRGTLGRFIIGVPYRRNHPVAQKSGFS